MKSSDMLLFLKYPYASAIIACIWIGGLIMIIKSDEISPLLVISVNLITTWYLSWKSFRGSK